LEALLGNLAPPNENGEQPTMEQSSHEPQSEMFHLAINEIDANPFQPRREFDEAELAELSGSIRDHGIVQPLAVRRWGERFQLIAGERRMRAALAAGWTHVPVRLIEADDRQLVELAIVENLQRKDLNPLEKAASFQQYLYQYQCTQEELAGRLHIDRSTIANLIRLLELPQGVQEAVRSGSITQGHARALLPLGDEREQMAMCHRIVEETLSVRAVESAVQDTLRAAGDVPLHVVTADGESKPAPRPRSEHLATLEQELRNFLGTKVEIKEGAKGKGKVVVHFNNHDEFERLRYQLSTPIQISQAG